MPSQPRTIGRYAVVDRLGQGGMGVVYRAWDPDLRRMVAIKVISGASDEPVDDDLFERFAREAQAAAALAHPNIVTIHDFGRHAGRPYIVMELVAGASMAQALQNSHTFTLAERVERAAELCDGLAYAHEQGVLHRDVKPANLVIANDGGLKILDFGIARLSDELGSRPLTKAGDIVGTPQYMSPEQLTGAPLDARSDIFAVGAVLYEWFSGRMAFSAPNPALVPLKVLHETPPPITTSVAGFPDELAALVVRAMAKDPAQRFARLEELGDRLRDWLRAHDDRPRGADSGTPSSRAVDGVDVDDAGLDGLLQEWEHSLGQLLDEPPDPAPAPVRAAAAVAASASTPAPPVRPAAATAPVPPARTWWLVAAALVLIVVAGGAWAWFSGRSSPAQPGAVTSPPTAADAMTPAAAPTTPLAAPAATAGATSNAVPAPATLPPTATPGDTRAASTPTAPATPRDRDAGAAPPRAVPGAALAPEVRARCNEILQRVGLGEELTVSDRNFLSRDCRDRSR